jgi:hypothetical protein
LRGPWPPALEVTYVKTYLFSGYARLPQDVSHQNLHRRVGLVVEVDERGVITACSSTLLMDLARDFFARLLVGRSVVTERQAIEAAIHEHYLGHSQAALLFALHQVFEAVDLSAPFGARGRKAGDAGTKGGETGSAGTKGREAEGPGARGRQPGSAAAKGREA